MGPLLLAATILVSAGTSLSDVLGEIAKRYEAVTGERVQINAGASSALARQITQGAPVDLFISADEAQMDAVAAGGRIVPGTRIPLLSNQLVVVVPAGSPVSLSNGRDLVSALVRRIAMANPIAVPAGVYGRRWLERLGLWKDIASKVVPLPTVRAALAAVREGRADAGIVYATDARAEPGVRVALVPEAKDVATIVYPAAVLKGPRAAEAARFLKFLQSSEAATLFKAAGFVTAVNH